MKRIFTLLFATMLVGQAWTQTTFEVKNLKYRVIDDNNVSVSKGSAPLNRTLNIPPTVKKDGTIYNVTRIGIFAFKGCNGLTSVTIPESVTSIDFGAFEGCSGLTSITIGSSVTRIYSSAFNGCSRLTEINVENDNTAYASENGVLFNKEKNNIILYPAGKTGSYNIPSSVTEISNYAFSECKGLTSVTIPNIASIGDYVFKGCSGLVSITIPNSVTSIGDYAFEGCSGLTSVTIPNSVTSIGNVAFKGCSSLISVTIPNSVTSIGNVAFKGCDKLQCNKYDNALYLGNDENRYLCLVKAYSSQITSCEINSNCKCIVKRVFFNCNELTEINVGSENTTYASQDGVLFNKDKTTIVCYPKGMPRTAYTIPKSVISIADDAFIGCSGLTSVTIGNSVKSIGQSAFSNCASLTSINIPEFVTTIGNSAFSGCSGLTSINIPESVTTIGNSAFQGCSGLASVSIPNSVTSICNDTFAGCSALTTVNIPESVTVIGEQAFAGCSSLSSICYEGNSEPKYYATSFNFVYKTIPVYVPSDYSPDTSWCGFTNLIKKTQ